MGENKQEKDRGVNTPAKTEKEEKRLSPAELEAENAALAEKARKLEVQLAHAVRQIESFQKAVERYASAQLTLAETIGDLRARLAARG